VRNFVIRLIINAVALALAAEWIQGIELSGGLGNLILVALVFGIVNALVKPILYLLSFPFIIVTLGLLVFVLNGVLLLLTARLLAGFHVDDLGTAIIGSLVISIVSWVMGVVLPDDASDG